ncbi:hypothetical protein ABFA07_007298 [Porites harrisoni]
MNKELMYYFHEVDTPTYERSLGANNGSASSSNMNNNSMKPDKDAVCNCNRAPETIFCQKCGKSFVGRRRMSCERHRNTIHLMDCAYCVFCKRQL